MGVTAAEKASILVEALPYIQKFYGKIVVIKYGGHAMVDAELKESVMRDIVLMRYVGMLPVLVHGGGPEVTAMLQRLGKESKFINGLRVTDEETMEVAEMVLEKINKEIVSRLNFNGGKAVGLSGKDAKLIVARKKKEEKDLGLVGEVVQVNPQIINSLLQEGYIPVIAPIGVGEEGESYNLNADHVAGELAASLGAAKLVLLTDVEGVFVTAGEEKRLLSVLKAEEFAELVAAGVISGGMIPKVACCLRALEGGVGSTHIIDGRIPHAILLEIFTNEGIGTMVVK